MESIVWGQGKRDLVVHSVADVAKDHSFREIANGII